MPAAKKNGNGKKNGYKINPKNNNRTKAVKYFDGQNILVSQYFEITLTQPVAGEANVLAYAVACDPNNCRLTLAEAGNCTVQSDGGVTIPSGTAFANGVKSSDLAFQRFTQFKGIFRQYKVNKVGIQVTVDRECGLDNPVIFLTDKGEAIPKPVTSITTAMNQGHKAYVLTEAKRQVRYGWRPSTVNEKQYHMLHDAVPTEDMTTLKVLQDIEGKADANGAKCKHQVVVTMLCSLKDSKDLNST